MASCSEQQGQTTIPMTAAMQRKVMSENLKDVRHKLFRHERQGRRGQELSDREPRRRAGGAGFNVGILDVDLHGPSIPHLLGSHGSSGWITKTASSCPFPAANASRSSPSNPSSKTRTPPSSGAAPKKVGAIHASFVADVKWGALDYLLIDSPPGTGDEHMTHP